MPYYALLNTHGCIDMKRISRAVLFSAAILLAAFWTTTPTDAGKKQPADPLSRTLQEAGLKQLEDEVVRQLGEAIEVGAPLRLDQRTAYPPATISIDDFQPKALELSPEAVKRPLEPGDYSILPTIVHFGRRSRVVAGPPIALVVTADAA